MNSRDGWIFSPTRDLLAFVAPLVVGFGVVVAIKLYGTDPRPTVEIAGQAFIMRPALIFGTGFLFFIDIPHLYATYLRVGFDRERFGRHRGLYIGLPLMLFVVMGMLGTTSGVATVWVGIAYINIWHTLRQQYGWLMLSRRKAGEADGLGRRLDQLMIYNATVAPILWLHAQPVAQDWLVPGDLIMGLPRWVASIVLVAHWGINAVWVLYQVRLVRAGESVNRGKWLIVATTWVAWFLGVVAFRNSGMMMDYLHAVPYLMLVFAFGKQKWGGESSTRGWVFSGAGMVRYLLPMAIVALLIARVLRPATSPYLPEAWAFALFMLPAVTHYVLDGFIWKADKSKTAPPRDRLSFETRVAL